MGQPGVTLLRSGMWQRRTSSSGSQGAVGVVRVPVRGGAEGLGKVVHERQHDGRLRCMAAALDRRGAPGKSMFLILDRQMSKFSRSVHSVTSSFSCCDPRTLKKSWHTTRKSRFARRTFAIAAPMIISADLLLRIPTPPSPPQTPHIQWLVPKRFAKTTKLPHELLFTPELRSEFLELPEPQRKRYCMYATALKRHRSIVEEVQLQLKGMALDPRGFPGGGSPDVAYRSTASAPSLRARESEVIAMGRNTPEHAGGNVRVVVRVRGFLPRGMSSDRLKHRGHSLTAIQRLSAGRSA